MKGVSFNPVEVLQKIVSSKI